MKTWHQPYICPFPQPNIFTPHSYFSSFNTLRKYSAIIRLKQVVILLFCVIILVPISKSRNIPEVVIARRGAGGVLGIWEGWVNWVKGSKWSQFTSNLRGRWTIPITTGGCPVSGREHKGEAKGN
jgi:hypothetical protein